MPEPAQQASKGGGGAKPTTSTITNPKRILAVAHESSAELLGKFITALTGTPPVPQPAGDTDNDNHNHNDGNDQGNDHDDDKKNQQQQQQQQQQGNNNKNSNNNDTTNLAGTTHHLPLSTKYYNASVPIWLDFIMSGHQEEGEEGEGKVLDDDDNHRRHPEGQRQQQQHQQKQQDWASTFLSEEAKEVLSVLGGIIVVFDVSSSSTSFSRNSPPPSRPLLHKNVVQQVGRVVQEGLGGWEWEGVTLAVGYGAPLPPPQQQQQPAENTTKEEWEERINDWEDLCAGLGMEFVYWDGGVVETKGKKNEYGEKIGIERVKEALESADWDLGGSFAQDDDDENDEEGEGDEFDFNVGIGAGEDMEALKKAIFGTNKGGEGGEKEKEDDEEEEIGDEDIKSLERMMQKLQAVRDMSAGLPEGERKKMAKRAVEEVMREL